MTAGPSKMGIHKDMRTWTSTNRLTRSQGPMKTIKPRTNAQGLFKVLTQSTYVFSAISQQTAPMVHRRHGIHSP